VKINGTTIRRSYMEVPTMDDQKWSSIPSMQADVFMADMEDSVPGSLKGAARERVLAVVNDPAHFGGREFVCRPNNIESTWGRDDLRALAEARAPFILYPKVRSVVELRAVTKILSRPGPLPELMVIIETPEAVLHMEEIAAVPGVRGLLFGPGDLAMETGIALWDGDEVFEDPFLYPRSKLVILARARGLEASEGLLVPDLHDLDAVRRVAKRSQLFGFTGNMTFYPSHLAVIHEVRTPKPEDLAWSRRVVDAYRDAQARGKAAITLEGRWLTIHQFDEAQQALRFAAALGLA
jgi:citrate lyase beta subunit